MILTLNLLILYELFTKDVLNLDWSREQTIGIEVPFTKAEVFHAISSLGSNKSPGPCGFAAEFFKSFYLLLSPTL